MDEGITIYTNIFRYSFLLTIVYIAKLQSSSRYNSLYSRVNSYSLIFCLLGSRSYLQRTQISHRSHFFYLQCLKVVACVLLYIYFVIKFNQVFNWLVSRRKVANICVLCVIIFRVTASYVFIIYCVFVVAFWDAYFLLFFDVL